MENIHTFFLCCLSISYPFSFRSKNPRVIRKYSRLRYCSYVRTRYISKYNDGHQKLPDYLGKLHNGHTTNQYLGIYHSFLFHSLCRIISPEQNSKSLINSKFFSDNNFFITQKYRNSQPNIV